VQFERRTEASVVVQIARLLRPDCGWRAGGPTYTGPWMRASARRLPPTVPPKRANSSRCSLPRSRCGAGGLIPFCTAVALNVCGERRANQRKDTWRSRAILKLLRVADTVFPAAGIRLLRSAIPCSQSRFRGAKGSLRKRGIHLNRKSASTTICLGSISTSLDRGTR
jgi:hypothetical protein